MKNIRYLLCSFILLLLGSFQAQATHVRSAQLNYTCVGPNQYEITLAIYRDCSGIGLPTTANISIDMLAPCATNSSSITLNQVSNVIVPLTCNIGSNACNGGTAPAFEKTTYTAIWTVPSTMVNCPFHLSYRICCRSNGITNLVGAGNQSFYTEVYHLDTIPCNNSPIDLNHSVFAVCDNTPTFITGSMIDLDGDSLVYSLANPLSDANTSIPFLAGLSTSNPFFTNSGITLDPATGQISFSATGAQNIDFDILVQEFRNGQLIGSTRKPISIITSASCSNQPPSLDSVARLINGAWVTQGTSTIFEICPGETLSFQMHYSDIDPTDSISLNTLSSSILTVHPNAIIQHFYTGIGNNQLTLQIDIPFASLDPFTLNINDNSCPLLGVQIHAIQLLARASCGRVEGYAFADTSGNCSLDPGEDSLGNYIITFSKGGLSLSISTDYTGYYNTPLDTGVYTIALSSVHPYRALCSGSQSFTNTVAPAVVLHNLPIQDTTLCTYMEVDIAAASLIRCFANQYTVSYCNQGTIDAPTTSIEVTLDSLFVVDSASLPITSQTGFTYTFNVGNVAPLQCGAFTIYGRLDTACTSPLGRNFCATAYIHPDTTCGIWSGSLLEVVASCQNDSVGFRILNKGTQAMSAPTNYVVIEDNIILHNGPNISLAAGASTPWVYYPATGATYYLAIDQELNYPWGKKASATIEGCLSSLFTGNPITTGLVNTFPLDDGAPYVGIDCQPSIGSYDPNDKQGFPIGYGGAHSIEPNVDLVYRIRFQNTGTAPAQDVVILDTLSTHLDIRTLTPTVASHAYTWRLKEARVLEVTFANIQLPDSGSSPLASQGFVDFEIKQQANNPLGTIINNKAAIYFDRNAPIITNTVFHTIDENFIVFTQLPSFDAGDALSITAFPNPFDNATTLRVVSDQSYEQLTLKVYNALGQLVDQTISQNGAQEIHFQRQGLPTGIYFYRLEGDDTFLHAGQLIAR
ncbi:MAG: DUF7619 domain-containing protein [Aureispira sp.]